jgi:DNA-directed RNA polymerase beta' subunit
LVGCQENWLVDQLSMSVQEVMSVLKIDSTDGLSDPKLGAVVNHKREARCATCDAGPADCPGHFGHLVLAKPIFHIGFMKTVVAVLRCVCVNCSRLLADEVSTSCHAVTLLTSVWNVVSLKR